MLKINVYEKDESMLEKPTVKKSVNPNEVMDPMKFIIEDDGKSIISGEFHTLFIEEEDPVYESIKVEIDGQPFLLEDNPLMINKEAIPKHKRYTLFVEAFGHEKTQLHRVIYELRKAEENDIFEVRIDSPGGYIKEGLTIYNLMKEKFTGRSVTYLDSTAYSMGALLFSMGDQRVAYEYSSLMYHNYSSGAFGKGDNLKTYIEHEEKNTHHFFENIIVKQGFLSQQEFDEMLIGRDFWFDCYEMAQRGICTHVMIEGFMIPSDEYIEFKDSGKPLEKFIEDKLAELEQEAIKDETNEKQKPEAKKPKRKKKSTKETKAKTTKPKSKPKKTTKPKKEKAK